MYLYKKVLVVNSNVEYNSYLADLLSSSGFSVILANNSFEGVDMLLAKHPDIIICNTELNTTDGFYFLSKFKEFYTNLLEPPFIFISKNTSFSQVSRALKLGVSDYISFPINELEFVKSIETKLEKVNLIKETIIRSERNWLSEELHDNIQQIILASLMHLRYLESDTANLDDISRESYFLTVTYLEKAIEETRGLSHQMQEVISPINFIKKINSIIRLLEMKNISLEVILPEIFDFPCSNDELFQLTRVCQELVNNVIKHSNATKVSLSIKSSSDSLSIILKDNGVGFLLDEFDNFGLTVLKRRLNKINASFSIDSEIGNGVEVNIRLNSNVKV